MCILYVYIHASDMHPHTHTSMHSVRLHTCIRHAPTHTREYAFCMFTYMYLPLVYVFLSNKYVFKSESEFWNVYCSRIFQPSPTLEKGGTRGGGETIELFFLKEFMAGSLYYNTHCKTYYNIQRNTAQHTV